RWRRSSPRATRTSASARRSEKACQRSTRRAMARRASSPTGCRGGGSARAQPAASRTRRPRRRLLGRLGPLTPRPLPAVLQLLDLLPDPVGRGVERERLLPGGQGVVVQPVLGVGVAQVLVDDRIGLAGLLDGALQFAERLDVASLLVVGPAEAVDEVAVVGLQLQGFGDELDRLVQVLAALGVH